MRKFFVVIGMITTAVIAVLGQVRPNNTEASMLTYTNYLPVMVYPTQPQHFLETFDGDPAGPLPWPQVPGFNNWDVTVHRRSTEMVVQGINAHHGTDCGPPPENTHYNTTYEGSVFQCKNHVMTAISDTGYGSVYLTPNYLLDFSNGQEAVLRFDMSTLKTSTRDWVGLWITPYDEHLQLPFNNGDVDLQGPPRNSLQIEMTIETAFVPRISRDGTTTEYRGPGVNWWTGYDDFLIPDAKRRDTFELRITQTHLKFCMPDYDFCWINMNIDEPLTWNQGIVQFAHASYNPTKDGAGVANTWHLDNFEFENALPFTIIKADRRYVNSNNSVLQFAAPSPNNAYLRFAAIGDNIEVSFNNGATWVDAQKNPQDNDDYHFSSYWTPIPAGVSVVRFRGDGWGANNEAWQARDITIWSKEDSSAVSAASQNNIISNPSDALFFKAAQPNFCYIPES